jgi:hypothetical protein
MTHSDESVSDTIARAWVQSWGEIAEELALKCANWAATYDRELEAAWDGIHDAIKEARR